MSVTKVSRILVSQPQPAIPEKSPFFELARRQRITVDYHPFIRVAGVSLKEFRQQRVEILDHTAVIFTSRTTVDSFFRICEEARITVPETMKYICQTEAVALYLQKYIVYRKRKISFADGSFTNLIELLIKHKEEKFLLTLSEPHKPDLPETMAVREKLLPEKNETISQLAMSAMDDWGAKIAETNAPALIIIEGLTMYLAQTDVQQIFRVISGRFQDATVFVETMNPMVVRRFQEKSIAASGAHFTWGVKDGETLAALLPDFRFMEEHGLTEGMAVFVPIYKLLDKIPAVRSISNRIVVLQQEGA